MTTKKLKTEQGEQLQGQMISIADIVCPYYFRTEQRGIRCSHILPESDSLLSCFADSKKKAIWIQTYCSTYEYRRCPLAKIADENDYWKTERD